MGLAHVHVHIIHLLFIFPICNLVLTFKQNELNKSSSVLVSASHNLSFAHLRHYLCVYIFFVKSYIVCDGIIESIHIFNNNEQRKENNNLLYIRDKRMRKFNTVCSFCVEKLKEILC